MLSLSLTYYLCLFAELLYPTYQSFRAVQSFDKFDDTQWLTYWIVYAFISTFENVGSVVLEWVPLYYEIKLFFIIWMIAPQTQGARVIYEKYIVPNLVKYGHKIDPIFAKADNALKSTYVNQVAKMVDKYGPGIAEQVIQQATESAQKFGHAAVAAAANYQQQQQQAQQFRKEM